MVQSGISPWETGLMKISRGRQGWHYRKLGLSPLLTTAFLNLLAGERWVRCVIYLA
jgi:hypothetical protein